MTWMACAKCRTIYRNPEMLAANLGKPLTSIPDPFGTHESFGAHKNARLRRLSGSFRLRLRIPQRDRMLQIRTLRRRPADRARALRKSPRLMLPTLGADRRDLFAFPADLSAQWATCCRFPSSNGTRKGHDHLRRRRTAHGSSCHRRALQIAMEGRLGMRWPALGVDYEMYGKDHLLGRLSSKIATARRRHCRRRLQLRALSRREWPEDFEIQGQRPHHRRMAHYGPPESIALFMFQKPRTAKRLYFDVIPKAVDDYIDVLKPIMRRKATKRGAGKSCLAHPWRQAAAGNLSGQLRAAAQSRVGLECP